jgi:hypothetical protein
MGQPLISTPIALLSLGCLMQPCPAPAQTRESAPGLPRVDVSASIGWAVVHADRLGGGPDRYVRRYDTWTGDASFGSYWTEHLKTEVDAHLTGEGTLEAVLAPPTRGASPRLVSHTFSTRGLTVGQQFQFGRNAWFHPHVVAGLAVDWARHTEERHPTYRSLRIPPYVAEIESASTIGPLTEVWVRPFVGTGFKAYMSERAFVRSDVRVALGQSRQEMMLKLGLGFDF